MRRLRRFARGAQDEARLGSIEEPGDEAEQQQRQIDHGVEAEEHRPDDGDVGQAWNSNTLQGIDGGGAEAATEKGRDAGAEDGKRQPGRILIGEEGQRQHAEQQRGDDPSQRPAEDGDRHRQAGDDRPEGEGRAHQHHAFDAEIEDAGFFDHKFAKRRIDQRRGGNDRAGEDGDEQIHYACSGMRRSR